jgi:hypothetical protein
MQDYRYEIKIPVDIFIRCLLYGIKIVWSYIITEILYIYHITVIILVYLIDYQNIY